MGTGKYTQSWWMGFLGTLAGMSLLLNFFLLWKLYQPMILEKVSRFKHPSPLSAQDHVRGDPAASVLIIEYSDFECPFCRQFHQTLKTVQSEVPLRWVYRHFPLDSHPDAARLAEASECASEQGRFWEFADAVFEAPSPTNWTDFLKTWAVQEGGLTQHGSKHA